MTSFCPTKNAINIVDNASHLQTPKKETKCYSYLLKKSDWTLELFPCVNNSFLHAIQASLDFIKLKILIMISRLIRRKMATEVSTWTLHDPVLIHLVLLRIWLPLFFMIIRRGFLCYITLHQLNFFQIGDWQKKKKKKKRERQREKDMDTF